jgi:hypothetical protein
MSGKQDQEWLQINLILKRKDDLILKKTVSDIIQITDIENWKNGDNILIHAPTGTGKSFFVQNSLYDYCKSNNKKMLYLTNRDILKDQFCQELIKDEKTDVIKIHNYQEVEQNLLKNKFPINFDYLVIDECHYFFNDANFNRKTDIMLKYLLIMDNVKILMSATPDLMIKYLKIKKIDIKEYVFKQTQNYYNDVYFYKNDKVIQKMLSELPENEKAIYFTSAKTAYETHQVFDNSCFVCSKHNRIYGRKSNKDEFDNIINNKKFNSQILCCTTTLDNGVNIKDKLLKHIIIDQFETDTIIQCLGRKRFEDGEKVNIYIKNKCGRSLNTVLNKNIKGLEQADFLNTNGLDAYCQKYKKKDLSKMIDLKSIDGNGKLVINTIMYFKFQYNIMIFTKVQNVGFDNYICKKLGININKVKYLDKEYDQYTIIDLLNRYVGKKLFKHEQEQFKDKFLTELFKKPKLSHKSIGLKTINAILDDYSLNYVVTSKKERSRKSEYYSNFYWYVIKL